ncbi:MAG: helix-turn-helix transcriptional regulator [Blautia sp.]|nr:helix-turn-helix transcriptional regulator [Blautia sp.]
MADPYDRVWSIYNQMLLENMENRVIHNPLNEELRRYRAIENGDVQELERILQEENYDDRRGLLSPDSVRQEIDIGIVVTTYSRFAAAKGGVAPEACYCLSDATIQEMEKCRDVETIRHIYRSTELRYCMMVKEARHGKRKEPEGVGSQAVLHISHCKDYVFSHLTSRLTIGQIADAIGLEQNYLSALFRRQEGITLKQYILQEKVTLAKNMLAYSDYSYIEIANFLCFSSQSHLGEQFRRITGMTMRQYRNSHGREDFLKNVVDDEE